MTEIKIEISDEAAKAIVTGAVILGVGYLIYRLFASMPDEEIPLPREAKDFSRLPPLAPSSVEEVIFHPLVEKKAVPLLRAHQFGAAIREASIALAEVIRARSGIEADATELVVRAFRGKSPVLRFVALAPPHVTNLGDGLIAYLEGFFKYTRKLHAHAAMSISANEALLKVNLAAYLARQVDEHTELVSEN